MPHFSFTSAWMEAMAGVATEVPPNPLQVLGAPEQEVPPWGVSEKQMGAKYPHMPWAANSETSGMSRTPSFGLPIMPCCHVGFGYPVHVPSTSRKLVWLIPPPQIGRAHV